MLYKKSLNEYSAFGAVKLSAASFLELSVNPSIKQTKYLEREGRQANGSAGGHVLSAPAYELITSQIALNAGFKFGESNITPSVLVGRCLEPRNGQAQIVCRHI
jgi:hypothetical protein